MHDAGFNTRIAVELEPVAVDAYRLNHPTTKVLQRDIRSVTGIELLKSFAHEKIHLLAGCPPCQGFSAVRRLNKKRSKRDSRNNLVLEYFRLVEETRPLTIMMENVPGLRDYYLFKEIVGGLESLGYHLNIKVLNVRDYQVPQNRRRQNSIRL